ncbi:hypothetical protein HCH15_06770 [Corynebacterium testudinoris]|uniref:Uncharacterized protein n=1 Tax=Corynebacterium testudinoris TaxID=136857 RepID=A0A0G3H4X2_9CORY|nr:hypothetical protein [Corynebacterium testudinoris]AKK07780.1 hypothetical protein CTEST_01600 [Corynebacterium testudinoris]MBX8995884.1 hypothetical protein [Corynebacterium testudinoris]
MSDKQLTVAELLARAANEGPTTDVPRRRRRRSLEDGGISVAELTGSIPAVKEKPAESKHSSVPIDPPEAEPTPEPDVVVTEEVVVEEPQVPTPATDQTVIFQKIDADDEDADVDKQEEEEAATGEIPALEAPEPEAELEIVEEAEVEEKTSLTGIILMTIIGVVLGVVVFKGFELLWENLSRPIVAALAVVVTGVMVGVVKALRTSNDGLSMFLAAVVGLVMTFGPLLVVML